MKIEDIKNEWQKDSVINQYKVSDELVRIPLLHSKYLEFIIEYRSKRAMMVKKINNLKNFKRRYYRGELSFQELKDNDLQQWQHLKPSNTELNSLFEQDFELNELNEKLEYYETGLSVVELIIRSLQTRGYELKTLTDWVKFQAGA